MTTDKDDDEGLMATAMVTNIEMFILTMKQNSFISFNFQDT